MPPHIISQALQGVQSTASGIGYERGNFVFLSRNTTAVCGATGGPECIAEKGFDACDAQLTDAQLAIEEAEEAAWQAMMRTRHRKRLAHRALLAAIAVPCIIGGEKLGIGKRQQAWLAGLCVHICTGKVMSIMLCRTMPLCTSPPVFRAGLLLVAVAATLLLLHRCV